MLIFAATTHKLPRHPGEQHKVAWVGGRADHAHVVPHATGLVPKMFGFLGDYPKTPALLFAIANFRCFKCGFVDRLIHRDVDQGPFEGLFKKG